MKCTGTYDKSGSDSRSREGAWIEMPLLERLWPYGFSRSREGAWIEIWHNLRHDSHALGRSREGAWIEICLITLWPLWRPTVAPARERGLKLLMVLLPSARPIVAPARERGLKCPMLMYIDCKQKSRSREGAWIEMSDVDIYSLQAKSLPRGSVD